MFLTLQPLLANEGISWAWLAERIKEGQVSRWSKGPVGWPALEILNGCLNWKQLEEQLMKGLKF